MKKKNNKQKRYKTKSHLLKLTTSFIDTGAFNASTISAALADPALALILPIWSDIEPDLECEPREEERLSENPEASRLVVTGGLLLPVGRYRLLESEDNAILRGEEEGVVPGSPGSCKLFSVVKIPPARARVSDNFRVQLRCIYM